MRPGTGLLAAVVLATLGLGCSRTEEPPKAPLARPAPLPVRVEAVSRRVVARSIEPVGTVRARTQTVLSSRIVAVVTAVHVGEGDQVQAGDLLVTLDDRDVRAQVRRAQAGVREARSALEELARSVAASDRAVEGARAQQELAAATLERYRALLERRSVAPQEYDEVAARARAASAEVARLGEARAALAARRAQLEARIEQAEAEVAAVGITAGYARITAPVGGIVVARTAEAGTLAAPGVALLTLEEERYRLEVTVEESEIRRIRLGQRAVATVDALGGKWAATVGEIVPAADPASRTFTVKLDLPREAGLRSGLYGRARFEVGEERVLAVPRAALVERGQLRGVFVVDDANVARLRLVTTGRALGEAVEVLSGLGERERVVVEGLDRLSDGVPVEPRG
jgi:membrane fusion protein, multidrug efflux system